MNEQIEIKKQIEAFKERVRFLRNWVKIIAQTINKEREKKEANEMQVWQWKDDIYKLNAEANHKEYLIGVREKDLQMFEDRRKQIIDKLNTEMGGLIKKLREKKFTDAKENAMSKSILKRFAKGYDKLEVKIADFRIAEKLLK